MKCKIHIKDGPDEGETLLMPACIFVETINAKYKTSPIWRDGAWLADEFEARMVASDD